MTTNRRYAASVDAQMDRRIAERVMAEQTPESLTDAELQLDIEPLTRAPRPRKVKAWVRFGSVPLLVEAEAVAWTSTAVAVRWRSPSGGEHRAWVWSGAVRDH